MSPPPGPPPAPRLPSLGAPWARRLLLLLLCPHVTGPEEPPASAVCGHLGVTVGAAQSAKGSPFCRCRQDATRPQDDVGHQGTGHVSVCGGDPGVMSTRGPDGVGLSGSKVLWGKGPKLVVERLCLPSHITLANVVV